MKWSAFRKAEGYAKLHLSKINSAQTVAAIGVKNTRCNDFSVQIWKQKWWSFNEILASKWALPGSNFFGKTPLFFRYNGVNAANAANLLAKRR